MIQKKDNIFHRCLSNQSHQIALVVAAVFLAAIAASGCATPNVSTVIPDEFFNQQTSVVIEPGDILRIQFYFHPELNQVQAVRADGKMALTFYQGIDVAGMTPDELQKKLVDMYSKDFVDPVITVNFEQKTSQSVYVAGEVDDGGLKPLVTNATVGQVLSMSKPRSKRAALNSVVLIRRYSVTEYRAYRLDADYESGKDRDVYLAGGDILFIPRNNITKVGDFVEQYIRDVIPPQMTVGYGFTFELNRE